jgi:hypothetical protein
LAGPEFFFFLNVSRRAAKFIDKKENGQETHTARFVGKPGETLNNGKPHLKHDNTYKTPKGGTHEAHSRALERHRSQCTPKTVAST